MRLAHERVGRVDRDPVGDGDRTQFVHREPIERHRLEHRLPSAFEPTDATAVAARRTRRTSLSGNPGITTSRSQPSSELTISYESMTTSERSWSRTGSSAVSTAFGNGGRSRPSTHTIPYPRSTARRATSRMSELFPIPPTPLTCTTCTVSPASNSSKRASSRVRPTNRSRSRSLTRSPSVDIRATVASGAVSRSASKPAVRGERFGSDRPDQPTVHQRVERVDRPTVGTPRAGIGEPRQDDPEELGGERPVDPRISPVEMPRSIMSRK